jgi:NhaA family Na+:H+ antiporter
VRVGVADLPSNVGWRHVHGAGWLGGIGFTMSLFIAALAFGESSLLDIAKIGVIAASVVAGVTGFALLRFQSGGAPVQVDDASAARGEVVARASSGGSPGGPGG